MWVDRIYSCQSRNEPDTAKWIETDPYFFSFFDTTVCLIIHVFCKGEPEIVFVLICPLAVKCRVHRSYKTCESTM